MKKAKMTPEQQAMGERLWNSDMEEVSSEEDFEYLQQYMEEHKRLPDGTMKLLRGVVSNEYKDRKFPGRFGRGQEVAEDQPAEEGNIHETSDANLLDGAKIWSKKNYKGGNKQTGLTSEDYDKLKGLTGEEQLAALQKAFNFYAMDDNVGGATSAE